MKRKWKVLLLLGLLVLVGGGVLASVRLSQRGVVTVQTGTVVRQDLTSIVTASGEIKPKNYINLGANTLGPAPITEILVKEGDKVRKGEVVARLESTQAGADVLSQKAGIQTALADSAASEAAVRASMDAIKTAQATVARSQAELDRTKSNLDRADSLLKDKLIARQDYEQKRAEYETAVAALQESQARLAQARSQDAQSRQQVTSAQRRVTQLQANLTRYADVFEKYSVVSPIDGVVTNLPVRVGETVVPGVQNSAASTVMTVADMSLITAEVKVDETDIVNVKLGQAAEVTIDAIPNQVFKGYVNEIGNTAILRSTGVAASQSAVSSQEAKDFKVVVALDNPPRDFRPGLSCTARITTAKRDRVLTVPIQSLVTRQEGDLQPKNESVHAASNKDAAAEKAAKQEVQGIFVVRDGRAEFHKVTTGITGATDIEVTRGLNEGDQIITGSYKVIRTLRNEAKVKIDNKSPARTESAA